MQRPLVRVNRWNGAMSRPGGRSNRVFSLVPFDRVLLVSKTPLLVVLGAYVAGATGELSRVGTTAALASALWLFLYAFNEATDACLERSFSVHPSVAQLLASIAVSLSFFALALSPTLAVLFLTMTVGQFVYSLPPLRLKRYWWFIVLVSGVVNPLLRIECGVVLGDHPVPPLVYAAVLLVHIGGASRTRLLRRDRDRSFGYRVAPDWLRFVGCAAAVLGMVGVFAMCLISMLPVRVLPIAFVGLAFTVYAWSGRTTDIAVLRKGWALFAPLAIVAMLMLWR